MVIKRSRGERIFEFFNVLLMVFLMFITVYPLLYVIFCSVSDPIKLMGHEGFLFWPLGEPTLKGYQMTLASRNIVIGYRNTIFYVVVGTFINLIMTSLGAYVLTRKDFLLAKPMSIMCVITMYFSGGLIPSFLLIKNLGLYDTVWSLLLPGAINTWNLLIMRTFFQGLPVSLEESAIIDGASDWVVFKSIILPLSKPIIAVMVLYYGVTHWNSWFQASIYLRNRSLYPLQLYLREILVLNVGATTTTVTAEQMVQESYYRELLQYCAIVVATIPILCVYPFVQKYFVQGVMIGAIKG
ncbi:MAG: carbohydrate ABC transporter permease [Clostridiales bacterium]|nr:carbohydrate ABC transporter permease [Clostridiales bacterium]